MRPPLEPGLSVGEEFSCGISRDGALKCWGYNASGQLGLENTMNRGDDPNELLNQPPVNVGTGRTTRAITAGYENTCALLDDYSVKCWGRDGGGSALGTMGDTLPVVDLGTNRTAKSVSRGRDFTCALLDDDSVKCWGGATWGQLGLGDTMRRVAPADMGDNLPALDFGGSSAAVAISAGALHACAIRSDGILFCWGSGNQGSTGLGSGEASLRPAAVDLGTQRRAKAVVAGLDGTCAILDNDSVKCWGYGAFGRLGIGELGSRGDAPQEMGDYLPAVNLGTGRTAKAVALGIEHACALLDDDSVKCWGRNEGTGCLGLGDGMNRYLPEHMGDALPRVNLGTGRTAKAIGAGYGFTCALLDEDTIKCWGRSEKGQLGLGTKTARGLSANQMGDALPALNFGW
jgi:E3 ubiquitin-protein ligase HERC3